MANPTASLKQSGPNAPADGKSRGDAARKAPGESVRPDLAAQFAVPAATTPQLLRWMYQFLSPVPGLVILACFWVTCVVATEVFTTRQTGEAVNVINRIHQSPDTTNQGLIKWITSVDPSAVALRNVVESLAVLIVLLVVFRYLREVSNMQMSMNMVFYIRQAVYDKLQRVGFGFHDAYNSGQLINRALSDLQNVRQFLQTSILTSLDIILIVSGYIILILTRSPWVAALALLPLPVWTFYILRFSKKVQPAARSALEAEDRNVSLITENIAGVHVVKAFATEKYEIDRYYANCDTFKTRVLTRIRMFANFQPVIRSIAQASLLSLFLVAGILVIKGKLLAGDLLILGGAMSAILARLQQVATINEQYQNAIVSARRLYEVLMAPPTVPELPAAKALGPGRGRVTFEGVSFGYAPEKPVLHDISFDVPGGSIVAIVGPTGAGKTTMVNLISRFYEPQNGRVLIDGVDVRDLQLASLRKQVAFVFQETYLFSATVSENIAYGRPDISPGEVEAAARLAQAHEFIEQLAKGYNTMLGERGSSLSGGQRQRLAIARAILANPRILILDDATASVDPETEDNIRRAMRFVMFDRTTFVIAHRISTVKQADVVIVIEEGRITQMGTHNQLMEQDGHYREIAAAQLYSEEDEAKRPKAAEDSPSHMRRMQQAPLASANAEKEGERPGPEPV